MKSSKKYLRQTAILVCLCLSLGACGPVDETRRQQLKEAWNFNNSPDNFSIRSLVAKNQYLTQFKHLPTKGQTSPKPWSGDYWPTYKGGITYRWHADPEYDQDRYVYQLKPFQELTENEISQLSPAEKYDLYLGRSDYPLTNYERRRTRVLKTVPDSSQYDPNFEIPTWEGLCHAWAPATLTFQNPASVVLQGKRGHMIPFGSSDIKALLAMFLHEAKEQRVDMIGERCNDDFTFLNNQLTKGVISEADYHAKINESACRDTNAGAFHLTLANEVGIRSKGFIIDITRDEQVWNQPVEGFQTVILNRKEGASPGAAKGTASEIEVETTVAYTTEIGHSFDLIDTPVSTATVVYRYQLELNQNGEIIGGEWLSEERPNFLWRQSIPKFHGFFAPLEQIYKASIKSSKLASISNQSLL